MLLASLLATYSPRGQLQVRAFKTRQVFAEQYTTDDDDSGQVTAIDTQQITAVSIQSPDDPECSYRRKADQTFKGYTVNLTETIDEERELNIIRASSDPI